MKTFSQYMEDSWGAHQDDQRLIAQIETKMLDLCRDLQTFNTKLTHGDEAMLTAVNHTKRSLETLIISFRTSVRKNTVSPERGDHPPVSINNS